MAAGRAVTEAVEDLSSQAAALVPVPLLPWVEEAAAAGMRR